MTTASAAFDSSLAAGSDAAAASVASVPPRSEPLQLSTQQQPQAVPPPTPMYSSPSPILREPHIQSALSFLRNPRVLSTPLSRRLAFLESKQLSAHEIAETLKRLSGEDAPEYQSVKRGAQQGRLASQCVAHLDDASVLPSTQSQYSSTNASSLSSSPMTSNPAIAAQLAQLQLQQHGRNGQQNLQQQQQGRSWFSILTSIAALGGLSSTAYLLARDWLPRIRILPKEQTQQPQQQQQLTQQSASTALVPASQQQQQQGNNSSAMQTSLPPTRPSSRNALTQLIDDRIVDAQGQLIPYDPNMASQSAAASSTALTSQDSPHYASLLIECKNELSDVVESVSDHHSEVQRSMIELRELLSQSETERKNEFLSLKQTLTQLKTQLTDVTKKLDDAAAASAAHSSNKSTTTASDESQPERKSSNASVGSNSTAASSIKPAASPASTRPSWSSDSAEPSTLRTVTTPLKSNGISSITRASPGAASVSVDDEKQSDADVRSETATAQHLPSLDSVRSQLTSSLRHIFARNTSSASRACVNTLLLYISNIASNPQSQKYRRILLNNSSYKQRVAAIEGGDAYLRAAGFELRAPWFEWTLPEEAGEHQTPDEKEKIQSLIDHRIAVLQASRSLLEQAQKSPAEFESHIDETTSSSAPTSESAPAPAHVSAATSESTQQQQASSSSPVAAAQKATAVASASPVASPASSAESHVSKAIAAAQPTSISTFLSAAQQAQDSTDQLDSAAKKKAEEGGEIQSNGVEI